MLCVCVCVCVYSQYLFSHLLCSFHLTRTLPLLLELKTRLSNSISPPRSYQRDGGIRRHSSQESAPTNLSPLPQKKHSAPGPSRNGGIRRNSSQDSAHSPQPQKKHSVPAPSRGMHHSASTDSNSREF